MDVWERERALFGWLLASLLVHLFVLAVLRAGPAWHFAPPSPPIEVDLAPPPPPAPRPLPQSPPRPQDEPAQAPQRLPLPERQIVAPPDAGEEAAPERETRLLSDRDTRVREESVKRADRPVETKPERPNKAAARDSSERSADQPRQSVAAREEAQRSGAERQGERVASLPRLDELLPRAGDVPVTTGQNRPADTASQEAGTARGSEPRRLLLGSGPVFAVHPGTTDFLPGIREGDITLLNTKAERFAPFVRRVAGRIFQHLDIRLRQAARSGSASPGHEFAVVEAVMDRQGRFLNARITKRESTSTFGADRVLLSVTSPDTFFDANPPPGAEAEDGNIHFVLLIDLQVVAVPDPRTGRMAVGYEGIAGVGLDALPEQRAR